MQTISPHRPEVTAAFAGSTSGSSGMHIDRIELSLISVPVAAGELKLPLLVEASAGVREALVCRVWDTDGAVGTAYANLLGAAAKDIAQAIERKVFPRLKGQPIDGPSQWWPLIFASSLNAYFNRETVMRGISLVDCALWDLHGHRMSQPVAALWGARRSQLPCVVLASGIPPDSDDAAFAAGLEQVVALGYSGTKLKVGAQTGLEPEGDARRVGLARRIAGPDFALIVDANQGWSQPDAMRFALAAQEHEPAWLEEPCFWHDDKRLLAGVRGKTSIPITAGQAEICVEGCRDLIEGGSIDICNFDGTIGGGATAWLQVAAIAARAGVDMVHHIEPQVGLALGCAATGRSFVELCGPDVDPFFHHMVENRPPLVGGMLELPDGPGWGWRLDESYLRAHRVVHVIA